MMLSASWAAPLLLGRQTAKITWPTTSGSYAIFWRHVQNFQWRRSLKIRGLFLTLRQRWEYKHKSEASTHQEARRIRSEILREQKVVVLNLVVDEDAQCFRSAIPSVDYVVQKHQIPIPVSIYGGKVGRFHGINRYFDEPEGRRENRFNYFFHRAK
jgi:hypothetical protein